MSRITCLGGVPIGIVEGEGHPKTGDTERAGRDRSLDFRDILGFGMLIPNGGDGTLTTK